MVVTLEIATVGLTAVAVTVAVVLVVAVEGVRVTVAAMVVGGALAHPFGATFCTGLHQSYSSDTCASL